MPKKSKDKKDTSTERKVRRTKSSGLAKQGSKIMKRAKEIRNAEPNIKWTQAVSKAGKELKEKKE